jgi:hypothetical protein
MINFLKKNRHIPVLFVVKVPEEINLTRVPDSCWLSATYFYYLILTKQLDDDAGEKANSKSKYSDAAKEAIPM